ncbi:MAG: acyltransferase [Candidatus Roizmanbacteria bacterium]
MDNKINFQVDMNSNSDIKIQREIKPLTSLRLIAAYAVLVVHFRPIIFLLFPSLSAIDNFFLAGRKGVDFFFILSGFIIWFNYRDIFIKKWKYKLIIKFFVYRIARLLPVNILATFLSLPILILIHTHFNNFGAPIEDWYNVNYFIATLLMIQEFFSPYIIYMWNQPTYTIGAELLMYILVPLIVMIFSKVIKFSTFSRSLFISIVVSLLIPICDLYNIVYYPFGWLLRLLIEFVSGILFCIAYFHGIKRNNTIFKYLHYLLPVIILVLIFLNFNFGVLIPFIGVWIFSLAVTESYLTKILSNKILLLGGYISYSMYMLHWVFIGILGLCTIEWPFLKARVYLLPLFILTNILIFVCSWLCWKYYEEPSRILIRNMYKKYIAK